MENIVDLVNKFEIDRLIRTCRENPEIGFFVFGNGNICVCDRDYAEKQGACFFDNLVVLKYLEEFIND